MLNKLSFKIGLLFFVFIVIIESMLFFALYTGLANDRVEEVMDNLLARGNSHSDVLEDNFNQTTMEHVGLMESTSDLIVVITNERGEVLISSDPVEPEMRTVVNHADYGNVPVEGKIVEDRWKQESYISTDSPITIDGEHAGHVFMFASTDIIRDTVNQISEKFSIIVLLTIGLTVVAVFILSRVITLPLIKMKEATEKLSRGDNQVELDTERRDELGELAHSITALSNDLEYLKTERKEFLASISHELRTPLTYIKGYADILHRQDLTEAEINEYTAIIREETTQLASLIKDLFELAKMDENRFVIHREYLEIKELIDSVKTFIHPEFSAKDLDLIIHCPEKMTAFVDPDRLQQVLINILDNAKKHSNAGSLVQLEVNQTSQNITIAISDEGEGIPAEELPYIFNRFYRVDKSRSRQGGGRGLGLAIAKEIIEAHGGNLTIVSQVGKGSKVLMTLPRGENNEKSLIS